MGLWTKLRDLVLGEPAEDEYGEAADVPAREEARSSAPAVYSGAGKVVLVRPERYVEAGKLADYLCEGYTVLLDLEAVSPEVNRRIVDFLSGSAYARDGRMLQVACKAYLLAPSGVDILDGEPGLPDDWEYDRAFGF